MKHDELTGSLGKVGRDCLLTSQVQPANPQEQGSKAAKRDD